MSRFDATQGAQIAQQIERSVERARVGRVVEVFQHVSDDDKSNFEVDVELLDAADGQVRAVPWQSPHNDEIKVPKVGDKVIVEYIGQAKKKPVARSAMYTNEDRPPKGLAGMWRKRVESGDSPAGSGDLYMESYTKYDENPRKPSFDSDTATPQQSYLRMAKKGHDLDDTIEGTDLPMCFEMVDNPADGEAHIEVRLNRVDGSESDNSWGVRFDLKTGEFAIIDGSGYGIESDGNGNFVWNYESINYNQGTTTSL